MSGFTSGFLGRLVGLPFRPALWRASAEQPLLRTALPLFVLILIADAAIGVVYAARARAAIYRAADLYESTADVLVFKDGRFSLSGPRIFRMTEGELTILIDPLGTVSESSIETPLYLVVREDRVIVRGRTQTRVLETAEYADPDRLVLDAVEARQVADEIVVWTLLTLFGALRPWFDLAASAVYALLAGALLHALRGRSLDLPFAASFKLALAASAATAVIDLALVTLQLDVPWLARPLLWLTLVSALSLLALPKRNA